MKHEIILELDFFDDLPGLYVYCTCSNDPLLEGNMREIKLDEIEDAKWKHLAGFKLDFRALSLRARRAAPEGIAFIRRVTSIAAVSADRGKRDRKKVLQVQERKVRR